MGNDDHTFQHIFRNTYNVLISPILLFNIPDTDFQVQILLKVLKN